MPSYQTEMILETTCEAAFAYLSAPANLPEVTQPELQLVVDEAPEQFELGSRILFSVSVMGTRVQSEHEIISFESPERFVEEQVEGPFAFWRHEHIFKPLGDSQVAIYDVIEYEPPGGLIGMILSEQRIRNQLDEGFAHRQDELKFLLENPQS